ncbi:MAG: helix-turn-helix domain-containing protein [Eubacterium sp.]
MDINKIAALIKERRETCGLTQSELAERLSVTDKAVSKWERAKGVPDISLIEPLARVLNISVIELMAGNCIINGNENCNITKSKFYACPICKNIVSATGEALVSCCGTTLPALEAEECDEGHMIKLEAVEDEYYISVNHPMDKEHYISFISYVTTDRNQLVKLYPQGDAAARFKIAGRGKVYCFCNRHGLFCLNI